MVTARKKIAFIAAPHEENGGGMGRVKDYIVKAPPEIWGDLVTEPLITRNHGGKLASLLLVGGACMTVLRARLSGNAGLVHVNFGDKGSAVRKTILLLFSRMIGVPTFLHFHAVVFEDDIAKLPAIGRWFAYLPFRSSTCNIVLGERWRKWLRDDVGVGKVPVEVLTNGVPIQTPAARPAREPGAKLQILFLGNLIERKGITDLLNALAQLPADCPAWEARFAGNGDVEHYSKLSADLGIGDRCTFLGWVNQDRARELLLTSDMMVLPSYHEGLPLVVLEALGQGTAVITTPVGAVPEVLNDGEDVMFVQPGDVPGLSAMIARLLKDRGLRERLVETGLQSFDRKFSVTAFRSNLAQIWHRYL